MRAASTAAVARSLAPADIVLGEHAVSGATLGKAPIAFSRPLHKIPSLACRIRSKEVGHKG